jgi:hypothetical protein
MVSDTRKRRARPRRAPIRPAQPTEPPAWDERRRRDRVREWSRWLLGFAWFGLFFAGDHIAGWYVDLIRLITFGSPWGMAIGGWLIYFAPFAALGVFALLKEKKVAERWQHVLIGFVTLMVPFLLHLMPATEDWDLVDIVSGAGGSDFIIGLRNGGLAGIVPLVVVPFIVAGKRLRERLGAENLLNMLVVWVAAFAGATLIAAITLAV